MFGSGDGSGEGSAEGSGEIDIPVFPIESTTGFPETGKPEQTTGKYETGKPEYTTGKPETGKPEMTTGIYETGKPYNDDQTDLLDDLILMGPGGAFGDKQVFFFGIFDLIFLEFLNLYIWSCIFEALYFPHYRNVFVIRILTKIFNVRNFLKKLNLGLSFGFSTNYGIDFLNFCHFWLY